MVLVLSARGSSHGASSVLRRQAVNTFNNPDGRRMPDDHAYVVGKFWARCSCGVRHCSAEEAPEVGREMQDRHETEVARLRGEFDAIRDGRMKEGL